MGRFVISRSNSSAADEDRNDSFSLMSVFYTCDRVKNEWSYTSAPPIRLHGVNEGTYNLYLN